MITAFWTFANNTSYNVIPINVNILAIDKNDVEERISKRLSQEELKRFRFSKQSFEDVVLEKCELIVSNFSLSFCDKDKFNELWDKIQNSIISNGYFVGNFFGVNDEWNNAGTRRTFFTKKQVEELFDNFEIIFFEEFDRDGTTRWGEGKALAFL